MCFFSGALCAPILPGCRFKPPLRSRQPNVCLAVLFLAKKSPNVFGGFISGQNLGSQNSVKNRNFPMHFAVFCTVYSDFFLARFARGWNPDNVITFYYTEPNSMWYFYQLLYGITTPDKYLMTLSHIYYTYIGIKSDHFI